MLRNKESSGYVQQPSVKTNATKTFQETNHVEKNKINSNSICFQSLVIKKHFGAIQIFHNKTNFKKTTIVKNNSKIPVSWPHDNIF